MIPKSVAIPARPLAYPWPTARTFHSPARRYSSTHSRAVSAPSPSGTNWANGCPATATSIRRPPSAPNVAGPLPSRLAVTTTRSITASISRGSTSTPAGSWRTPGAVGWL